MPNRNRFPNHKRRNRPSAMKTRQAKRLRRRLRTKTAKSMRVGPVVHRGYRA